MTTGEGGIITTSQEEKALLYASLRNQGRDVFDHWLNYSRLGYNYRLDEMSAALGVTQLARIEQMLERRAQVVSWYTERLEGLEGIELPNVITSTTKMSWFVYVIRLHEPLQRNTIMRGLESEGIPSRPYFSALHLMPYYQSALGYRPGAYPVTESLSECSLALPFFSNMAKNQVDFVCDRLCQML